MNQPIRAKGKYSQSDEDVLIERYFANEIGSLLDLGANDGRSLSNSLAAIERGWQAVLVEPSKTAFSKLQALHSTRDFVTCYNLAIGEQNGEADFWESGTHLGTGDTALISTLIPTELDKWRGSQYDNFVQTKTEVQTWQTFYENLPIKQFDLISLDIEGLDYFILHQMNLTEMCCQMLIVEFNGKDEDKFTEIATSHGLTLYSKNFENLIFVK